MNKILLICFILLISHLVAIEIIDGENIYILSGEHLSKMPRVTVKTERYKNDELKQEDWEGVSLDFILQSFGITNYSRLKCIAFDNYLVHLDKKDLNNKEPILAIIRDGVDLPQEKTRLVSSLLDNMFWVQNIRQIIIDNEQNLPLPSEIIFAESILSRKPLSHDLQPFVDAIGFSFRDLIDEVFPFLGGNYLLIGNDGVRHTLDFDNYLSNAVLVLESDKYALKSPQMPTGMWLKGITYIQKGDLAIVFAANVNNIREIAEITGWDEIPVNLAAVSSTRHEFISPDTEFTQLRTKNITGIILP